MFPFLIGIILSKQNSFAAESAKIFTLNTIKNGAIST
jgi:hypothetical protein